MTALTRTDLLTYGLFGLPLALVALPIYVYVPPFYAERFGLSLTAIGAALLATRLLDALIDPAIGLWVDRVRTRIGYHGAILLALPALALGFVAVFQPLAWADRYPRAWFVLALALVYLGFSLASIAYQSWGAALTQARAQRSRVTAAREAFGLAGVVLAAAIPGWIGMDWLPSLFVAALILGAVVLLRIAARPPAGAHAAHSSPVMASLLVPLRERQFRWLFGVFLLNGIAAAIPATLFVFFVQDQLRVSSPPGLFLVLYFVAAAASVPFWAALARRLGEARAWLFGMLLAIAAFAWAYGLSAGDGAAFVAICIASGLALGADLVLPPALLAAVIAQAGHAGWREGSYFGVWNWATKMNLALAAGVSLPLLERLGYVPGMREPGGLQALSLAYALLPCLLKLAAAALLWRAPLRHL